jgi:hypothetical protein
MHVFYCCAGDTLCHLQKFLLPGTSVSSTCNPSYSGGRDQEDHGLKPAQENSSRDPISKKSHHKKGLVEWLDV